MGPAESRDRGRERERQVECFVCYHCSSVGKVYKGDSFFFSWSIRIDRHKPQWADAASSLNYYLFGVGLLPVRDCFSINMCVYVCVLSYLPET